ncbi:unnamed protein product [Ceutorhynchus assimilis]|uniref:CCHC-type domain-containing protein n=1 Tax=Ceutorhynchus assimilis TaxID=467358 RepID=A0A9N9QIT4_9CUCU|nr:unnamed protein product [Ceutorhynchus assimilis]
MSLHFSKSVPFSKLFKDAANYETKPGQNLGDYCFREMSKLRALNRDIPDAYLIDAVIGGIRDDNILRTVRAAQHEDGNALYAYLNTVGAMPNEIESLDLNKAKFKPSHSTSFIRGNFDNKELSRASGSRVTCLNCGFIGHTSVNCREPCLEWHNWKRLGHTKEKCPCPRKDIQQVEILAKDMDPNIFLQHARIFGKKK